MTDFLVKKGGRGAKPTFAQVQYVFIFHYLNNTTLSLFSIEVVV
jgi:hypothetical protein